MTYFGILINSVLPIIFISFIGFVLGKKGIFSLEEDRIINKFVAMIGVPAISIAILQKGNLDNLNLELCLLYIIAEMIVYISAFLITKYCFGRDNIESILIAIASSFSNHILFIYPIVKLIFPAEELIQVYGIIIFDVIILATSIFLIDVFSDQGKDIKKPLLQDAGKPCCYWTSSWNHIGKLSYRTSKGCLQFSRIHCRFGGALRVIHSWDLIIVKSCSEG